MTHSALFGIVSGDFVPTGGMDIANLALAGYWARRGAAVEVVAYRVAEELAELSNVRVHAVAKPFDSYFAGAPFLDLRARQVARDVLRRGGRFIVNGGNSKVGDVNWVHYVHAAHELPPGTGWRGAKRQVDRRLALVREREALGKARLVIANSAATRAQLVDKLGVREDRIHVVYIGLDPRFRPVDDEARARVRDELGIPNRPTLVFIGALGDRRKGFDTLFQAWQSLGEGFDSTLLVVGKGAELESWRARSARAGLARSIRFLGFRRDVPEILKAADAIVAPARYEPFGQAVQEALACGLPAIVSAGAGVTERIADASLRSLFLDDPESVLELGDRLRRWRGACDEYRKCALALAPIIAERTWDAMSEEMTTLIARTA